MDPNANLVEQLELARSILDEGKYPDDRPDRLAELVIALDEWIKKGGFLPVQWPEGRLTMFVLRRDDGKYVAPSGSEHSYVDRLEEAQVYRTREEAEDERCVENETIVALSDLLRPKGG